MHTTKIIQFLHQLTNKEVKRLYDYLASPFFVKSEAVVAFFEYVLPALPIKEESMTKESVWKHIYPKETYHNLKFNNLCFAALELAENFYIHLYLEKQEVTTYASLLLFYQEKQLLQHGETLLKSLRKQLDKSPIRNHDYFEQSHFLCVETNTVANAINPNRQNLIAISKPLEELESYYLIRKLDYLKGIYVYGNIFAEQSISQVLATKEFLASLADHPKRKEVSYINILYLLFVLEMKETSKEERDKLMKELLELSPLNDKSLSHKERHVIGLNLQNICIKEILKGRTSYQDILFEVCQEILNQELVFDHTFHLNFILVKNMSSLGMRLKKTAWVTQLFETYLPVAIKQGYQQDVLFLQAEFCFYQGQYAKVYQLLQNASSENTFFEINRRILLIQCYYEEGSYETFLSAANALKVYVHRNKVLNSSRKISSTRFANLAPKLLHCVSINYCEKLRAEISEESPLSGRIWLLKMLDALQSKM